MSTRVKWEKRKILSTLAFNSNKVGNYEKAWQCEGQIGNTIYPQQEREDRHDLPQLT